ncbi:MAG: FxsA family protein [Planctomycetota bacterium]|nr:FxsA family protein [Planctomycetota bacterium]
MGCYLVLLAVAFGFLDLYLMADIFRNFGFLIGLGGLFLPSMLLGPIALRQRHRLAAQVQVSPQALPGNLTESLLLLVASGLFLYPGPLSTLLGILLLLPPVRRAIIALFVRKLEKSLSEAGGPAGAPGGGPVFVRVVSINGQTHVSTSGGPPGPAMQGPPRTAMPGGLKSVEGRTLDDDEARPLLTDGSDEGREDDADGGEPDGSEPDSDAKDKRDA